MTLDVPEGAEIHQDVESVGEVLQRPQGLIVRPASPEILVHDPDPLLAREGADPFHDLRERVGRVAVQHGRHQPLLRVLRMPHQRHRSGVHRSRAREVLSRQRLHRFAGLPQIGTRIRVLDQGGDDPLRLCLDPGPDLARLGQGVREQLGEEVLQDAPVDRHPDVRESRRWQDVAKDVARLGPAGRFVRPLGLALAPRGLGPDRGRDLLHQARVGVEEEDAGVLVEPRVRGRHEPGLAVELVRVEDDVARGLLGEGGEAGVLQHLARDDGDILDRQVGHGMLRHRGVAVPHHPLLVKRLGLLAGPDEVGLPRVFPGEPLFQVEILVADERKEVPAQALAASAVIGEENRHHFFGEIVESEDRPIHVGDVGPQDRDLVRGEGFNHPHPHGVPVRSRYEITCPISGISLRLLMPFRNFSGQVIL